MNPTAATVLLARAASNTVPMNSPDGNQKPLYLAETDSRLWRMVLWITGVFSILVGLTLLAGHLESQPAEILKSPELTEAKTHLRLNPTDDQSKKLIRELDLKQREQYFRRLSQMHSGTYLLLAGAAAFLLAATRMARFHQQPHIPLPKPEAGSESSDRAKVGRWAVALSGTALGAFLFFVSLGVNTP